MQLTPFLSENLDTLRTADILSRRYGKLPSEILNLPHDEYELNVQILNTLTDPHADPESPLNKSKELLAEEDRIRAERV